MKILFAEDEPDLREVVTAYLDYQGYNVRAVENGAEAVRAASEDSYDAIVMDVMMPVMDGFTAMKAIRASGNTLPAIFLTAKSQVTDRVEGLDAGADDYLTKPFAMEELAARLRALCRRRRDYKVRIVRFANMELDTEQSELRAHNSIGLSVKEARLLASLMTNGTMTADELLDECWHGENAGRDTLGMYIAFLRAKLKSVMADAVIEDENGGYRLREKKDVR